MEAKLPMANPAEKVAPIERTVTITLDEYRVLVTNNQALGTLMTTLVQNMDNGYSDGVTLRNENLILGVVRALAPELFMARVEELKAQKEEGK